MYSNCEISIFIYFSVQMSSNPNSIIKEGFVQRYKAGGLFSSAKWKSTYALLYPDSTLALYNERVGNGIHLTVSDAILYLQGESRPAETILLRNVVPYICVGFMTDRMPVRRPSLPPGTAVQRLVSSRIGAKLYGTVSNQV
jgi:hypothetical protein